MRKYYFSHNNGVRALVSEETYLDIDRQRKIYENFVERDRKIAHDERWRADFANGATKLLTIPVFTFVNEERLEKDPWFTGSMELYDAVVEHIRQSGGVVLEGSFFVPFSNGCELGIHGKNAMFSELLYVTTSQQFKDAFGVGKGDLIAKASATV